MGFKKDHFGFLQSSDLEQGIYYSISDLNSQAKDLDEGDEVEFLVSKKAGKPAAIRLVKLPPGSVQVVKAGVISALDNRGKGGKVALGELAIPFLYA